MGERETTTTTSSSSLSSFLGLIHSLDDDGDDSEWGPVEDRWDQQEK